MAQVTYSPRNTPQTQHGTVEPIKVQVNTQPTPRTVIPTNPSTQLIPERATPEATKPQGEDQISSKFAALARKEKAIRQQQVTMAAREQEFKQLQDEITKAKAYRERLKSNPLDVLNEEGVTYDDLVRRAVNPANQEMVSLQSQVRALEESIKRQQEESQKSYQTQREQAEKQISMDVKSLISLDPAYETVRDMGAEEAVTQLITATYDQDGVLLTTEEAAKQVEAYLIEEATRIANVPSIKKRLSPAVEAMQQQVVAQAAPIQTGIKTLSHAMTATTEAPARTWAQKKAQVIAKYSNK